MITFKQYLSQSRAPLYHATFLRHANKILEDNTLYGSVQENGSVAGQRGVFVTRSLKHAEHLYGTKGKAIFVLDQQKLAHKYKIIPIKNHQDYQSAGTIHKPMYMGTGIGGNEFEEFIPTNRIDDIDQYILSVIVLEPLDINTSYKTLRDYEKIIYK